MEKLGRTSLPYWDLFSPIPNPDPDKYDMSYYEMSNIQQMIRLELAEYNKHSTTGPMKHDDGVTLVKRSLFLPRGNGWRV